MIFYTLLSQHDIRGPNQKYKIYRFLMYKRHSGGKWKRALILYRRVVSRTSFRQVVTLRCDLSNKIEPHRLDESELKMITEENTIMQNQENEDGQRIIPLPELAKDFALVVSTAILLLTITVGILGVWRRRIVQEDPMTTEFKALMERGNNLAKKE